MTWLPPNHSMISPLKKERDGVQLWIVEFNGVRAVTRLFGDIPQPLDLEKAIEGLAFGRVDSAGFPSGLVHHLTGYAVRNRLGSDVRLPTVLAAGLARDSEHPDTGAPYVTAAWVEGEPLAADGRTDAQIAQCLLEVLDILSSLHGAHVVYGDLKPDNIIVGKDGSVYLIDLETVRRVPAQGSAVPATALTPPYAAPEIVRQQLLFLASDIFAFGVTASRLLAGGLSHEAGFRGVQLPLWHEAIDACLVHAHAERPSAAALAQHLRDQKPLQRPPEPENTIRVTDRAQPSVDSSAMQPVQTTRPSEVLSPFSANVLSAEIPVTTIPPPAPPAPAKTKSWVGRTLIKGVLAIALFIFSATTIMERRANELSEKASATLDLRQTNLVANAEKNSLDSVYSIASSAVDTRENINSTSIFSLAEVLESRWHYEGANWNPKEWERDRIAVERALKFGESANNRLASAYLHGGSCWRRSDDANKRDESCREALAATDAVDRLSPPGWRTVESAWVRAMTYSHMISRLRDDSPEQFRLLQIAAKSCTESRDSASLGVNGIYLLKECLRIHGRARDLNGYLATANAFLNLSDAQNQPTGEARATVLWSVDPVCGEKKNKNDVAMEHLRPGRMKADDRGQRIAFCRLVGAKALGCDLQNPTEWRPCLSYTQYYWWDETLYCTEYADQPSIPWADAISLQPIRLDCPIPG